MEEAIRAFAKQFVYKPVIENEENLLRKEKIIVAGMGGSHLAAGILKMLEPKQAIVIHRGYGLPSLPEDEFNDYLLVASSYSGNTEEIVDALQNALQKNMAVAVISTNGTLIKLAKEKGLPYIQIPDTGIQPRSALGFSLRALLKATGREKLLEETGMLADTLNPDTFEEDGKALAKAFEGKVPIIYASEKNEAIAYNWKIKCNETGKIPAFYNVFSELNHNEMAGFDVSPLTKPLTDAFSFIFIRDENDHPRIQKRMTVLKKQYEARGLPVYEKALSGETVLFRIFSSLLLADWMAYYTALQYNREPEAVHIIEEFKKLIAAE